MVLLLVAKIVCLTANNGNTMHTHCFTPQPPRLSARTTTELTKRKHKKFDYGAIPTEVDEIQAWLSQAALDLAQMPAQRDH